MYRQTDWTAFDVKDKNPLFFIGEKAKVNIDLQPVDQDHAYTFRLLKRCTTNHFAWTFICNTKRQCTAAIVCQRAAAFCRFAKIKTIFCFLELDVLALFGL